MSISTGHLISNVSRSRAEQRQEVVDAATQVIVSFATWPKGDLKEVRADTFASNYLLPPELLKNIPDPSIWDERKSIEVASKLKVSTIALAVALKEAGFIDDATFYPSAPGRFHLKQKRTRNYQRPSHRGEKSENKLC